MSGAKRGFRVGEAADRSGVSRRALRHYERRGLLVPERAPNDYRIYSERQVRFAMAIRDLRSVGVPLTVIGKVISIKAADLPFGRKVEEIMTVLCGIVRDLRAKREELNAALRHVEGFRRECSRALRTGSWPARNGARHGETDR